MSTLVYPQLGTGALSQYPIRKTRRTRTAINTAPDGSTVRLADTAAETVEWRLEYADLTDDEAAALEAFFTEAEGSLTGFTFLDPAGNLLAWSGDFHADVWQKGPLLQLTAGIADPAGGMKAWHAGNTGGAGQAVGQTIAAPGGYWYCFSVYVRSEMPATVRLRVGDQAFERVVSSDWSRLSCVATPAAGVESIHVGIEVAAGSAVDVYGPQLEPQQAASAYRTTTRGGVYGDAHLNGDVFSVTRTGCNRNSCTVNIIHANHL